MGEPSIITLSQAWSQWWSGNSVTGDLWGLSIRWWSRIGQVLQLLGSMMIVFDIIGAERIRNFVVGIKNRSILLIRFCKKYSILSTGSLFAIGQIFRFIKQLKNLDNTDHMSLNHVFDYMYSVFGYSFIVLFVLIWFVIAWAFLLGFILTPILNIVLFICFIMDKKYLSNLFKAISITLIVVGTHFSLLAL